MPVQGSHIGHSIQVDVLQFVIDQPSDVANLDRRLRTDLALDSQVERIEHVRTELRINRGRIPRRWKEGSVHASVARAAVGAGEERLWQRLGCRRQRSRHTIRSDSERICRIGSSRAEALSSSCCALTGNRLQESRGQQRRQDVEHAIRTAVHPSPATADDGLVLSKNVIEETDTALRIPSYGNSRAQAAIENIVGILLPLNVADVLESQYGIVVRTGDIPGERGSLALGEIICRHDWIPTLVHEHHLFAIQLVRWKFQLVSESIADGEAGLQMPAVVEIQVVRIRNAVRDHRLAKRLQAQVRNCAREQGLRLRNNAQDFSIEIFIIVYLSGRYSGGYVRNLDIVDRRLHGEPCCRAAARRAHLVHVSRHDALPVVITSVSVPVVFELSTELKYVIAMDQRKVVAEDVVFAVPITLTSVLCADAIWNQRAVATGVAADFSANLQRPT